MAYTMIGLLIGLILSFIGFGYLLHRSRLPRSAPELAANTGARVAYPARLAGPHPSLASADAPLEKASGEAVTAAHWPRARVDAEDDAGQVPPTHSSYWSRARAGTKSTNRELLKSGCLALLDAAAVEHPAGHGKLFARYVLRSQDGDRIELMFEKGERSRSNLWLSASHAARLGRMAIESRDFPASALYQPAEPGGKPVYGRHAALKSMRDLANADLVRLTIGRVDQMEVILVKLAAPEQAT